MKISSEIEIFKRDRKYQSRLIFFNLWALRDLDFTKDPRPLYYKTPPCVFYHEMSVVRPFSVLSKDESGPESKTGRFLSKAEILGAGVFSPLPILALSRKNRRQDPATTFETGGL